MLQIFIDADACPVKEQVYRVAQRCGLRVTVVANSLMWVPGDDWVSLEVVGGGFDAADDWIVDNVDADDIVIQPTYRLPTAASRMALMSSQRKVKHLPKTTLARLWQPAIFLQNFGVPERLPVDRHH